MMNGLTIAFDLDGTLVDTAPDLIAATNHVLATLGIEPAVPHVVRPAISFGARAMIEAALAAAGRHYPPAEIDRLLQEFLAFYEANIAVHSRPFPGVVDVLHASRRQGARLAVCTNKREHLSRLLLGSLGIADLFDGIAGRDTFAVCKPDPGHLVGVVQLVNGDIARAIMVGDSNTDITTARRAGVPSIAVTFGYTDIPVRNLKPDAVIDHYEEFMRVLAGLLDGGRLNSA